MEGEAGTWGELTTLMRATFVPRTYHHKLLGDLQDLRQGNKGVIEYYFELVSLTTKVWIHESTKYTQARFMHGLNIHLRHKVQVEMVKGISMEQMVSLAEVFEKQGKELTNREKATQSPQEYSGGSYNKWNPQVKKVETLQLSNQSNKTPLKAIIGPSPPKGTPTLWDRRTQCYKCKGY